MGRFGGIPVWFWRLPGRWRCRGPSWRTDPTRRGPPGRIETHRSAWRRLREREEEEESERHMHLCIWTIWSRGACGATWWKPCYLFCPSDTQGPPGSLHLSHRQTDRSALLFPAERVEHCGQRFTKGLHVEKPRQTALNVLTNGSSNLLSKRRIVSVKWQSSKSIKHVCLY